MLSHVWFFCDLMDCSPLSMGFLRQEYWSGYLFPSPEDLPNPGIETVASASPELEGRFFTTVPWNYKVCPMKIVLELKKKKTWKVSDSTCIHTYYLQNNSINFYFVYKFKAWEAQNLICTLKKIDKCEKDTWFLFSDKLQAIKTFKDNFFIHGICAKFALPN